MKIYVKKPIVAASYAVIFILTMILYTCNNDFPYFYHATEPSKVEQITIHNYNFNHPLLMLNSVSAAVAVAGADTPQEKAEVGRFVSAVYSSLTVLLLMGCSQIIAGWCAAVASGVLMSFSPLMINLSHFFKEDPTFLFGVSLTLFAAALMFRKPGMKTFVFTAAAAALASSGKYVGLIFLPMGLFAVMKIDLVNDAGERIGNWKRAGYFMMIFLAVFIITNIQMIIYFQTIIDRFFPKVAGTIAGTDKGIVALQGHGGARTSFPLYTYVKVFFGQSSLIIPLLVIAYFIHFVITYRVRGGGEKFMVAFFFLFTFLISGGKVASGQYFLPQEMLSHMFAAVIIARVLLMIKDKTGEKLYAVLYVLFIAVVSLFLFPFAKNSLAQFGPAVDSRKALVGWMETTLQPPAKVAGDSYTNIQELAERSSVLSGMKGVTFERMNFTGDLVSLDNAAGKGYTHIVVAESSYGRFFDPGSSPAAGAAGDAFLARRAFYQELFSRGILLWESRSKYGGVIDKALRVYKLPAAEKDNK